MAVPLRTSSVLVGSTMVEHVPDPAVARAVVCTWDGDPGRRRTLRMLPDGCADLLWDGSTLLVAGAVAAPSGHPTGPGPTVGLRLRPGAVGPLLGVPAHELPAAGVPVTDVRTGPGGRWASGWTSRLAAAPGPAAARAALEALVAERLRAGHGPDPRVLAAARGLADPARGVDDVARAAGLSPRELRRRFADDVGHGPKALQRVLRFRRVLAAADSLAAGRFGLGDAAVAFGYADQAHLCRESRALAGVSPGRLLATWSAHAGRNVQDTRHAAG